MRERELGWTQERVPIVGQGTWRMEEDDPTEVVEALRRGLDLGMRHVDTAELYGGGEVERRVGEALRGRRDQVFLTSKVSPSHATYAGTLRACEQSLKRLETDHLDLYLLHWPGSHPLEETVRAFEALVKAGKTRFWGLSNFDLPELAEALAIAGEGRIACNQVLHHLLARQIEHALVPWCDAHQIAVVGYSPFGSGQFPSPRSAQGQALAEVARAHRATPHQVALQFLLQRGSRFSIPKASRAKHAEENAAAAALTLSGDDLRALEGTFPLPEEATLPVL
jgi:diketogulonate reductase-like aldo/keto reductase